MLVFICHAGEPGFQCLFSSATPGSALKHFRDRKPDSVTRPSTSHKTLIKYIYKSRCELPGLELFYWYQCMVSAVTKAPPVTGATKAAMVTEPCKVILGGL
jgi:hypothetical protein